jgi:hypothetical protein
MPPVRFGRRRSTGSRSDRYSDKRQPNERIGLQGGQPRRSGQFVSCEPISQCFGVRVPCSDRTSPPFLDDDMLSDTPVCLGLGQWTMGGDPAERR